MRASIPLSPILLLLLVTFSSAWPLWPRWLPELDSIVVRQNQNADSSSSGSESPAPSTAAPTSEATSAAQSDSAESTGTGTITRGPTATGSSRSTATGSSGTKSGSISGSSGSSRTRSTSYDARLPAGGISMQTPAVSDGAQYYKIGEFVTFAWNYTSLSATPTAINVMATCKENNQLYTIAMNQTVAGTGAVTWDTGSYQATAVSDPLLTETYTLLIYDAASSISATAQAGYLAVFNTYTFGMYSPQPYVPLSEFVCATCSGALGDMERAALKMVVGMSIMTVLSFTWFVGGTGVIW